MVLLCVCNAYESYSNQPSRLDDSSNIGSLPLCPVCLPVLLLSATRLSSATLRDLIVLSINDRHLSSMCHDQRRCKIISDAAA